MTSTPLMSFMNRPTSLNLNAWLLMVGGMGQRIDAMREVRLRSLYRIWQRHTALAG